MKATNCFQKLFLKKIIKNKNPSVPIPSTFSWVVTLLKLSEDSYF